MHYGMYDGMHYAMHCVMHHVVHYVMHHVMHICHDQDGGLRPLDDALAARLQRRGGPAALIAARWAAEDGAQTLRRSL